MIETDPDSPLQVDGPHGRASNGAEEQATVSWCRGGPAVGASLDNGAVQKRAYMGFSSAAPVRGRSGGIALPPEQATLCKVTTDWRSIWEIATSRKRNRKNRKSRRCRSRSPDALTATPAIARAFFRSVSFAAASRLIYRKTRASAVRCRPDHSAG